MGKSRLTRWIDAGIFCCIAGILFLVPLAVWTGASLPFELPKIFVFRALLYLSFIMVVLKFLFGGGLQIPSVIRNRWFLLSLCVLILVFSISALGADSFWMSLLGSSHRHQGLWSYLHYFLFFIVLCVGLNKEAMRKVFVFGFLSFFIVIVYAVMQKMGIYLLGLNVDEFLGRVFSTLGHPSFLGSYIVLMFFPVLALVNKKRWSFVLGAIMIVLALVGVYFSGSRASIVGLIAGLVVFVYSLRNQIPGKKYTVSAIAVAILWVSLFGRFSLDEENLRSVKTRMIMWPQVIEMVQDSPYFGYGPDTFPVAFAPYMSRDLLEVEKFNFIPDRAHNIVLQMFSDFGFLGGLVIFFIFAFWWGLAYLNLKKSVIGKSFLVSLFAIFVSHFFGFSTTAHLVLITFFCAFLVKEASGKEVVFKISSGFVSRGLILAFVFALIGTFFVPNILLSSSYSDNEGFAHLLSAREYAHYSNFDLAEKEFEEATRLMPLYPPVYFHKGHFYYENSLYDEAEKVLEYYVSLAPEDFGLEKYDKINDDYKTALEWLEKIRKNR